MTSCLVAWALLQLAAAGCALDSDLATDEPGVTEESIVNGTAIPADLAQNYAPVRVDTYYDAPNGTKLVGTCSGILLTNEWVLTAGHCIDPKYGKATGIEVFYGDAIVLQHFYVAADSATDSSLAFYRHPGYIYGDKSGTSVDAALTRVRTPFVVKSATTGFRNRFYGGAVPNWASATLTCMGAGKPGPYPSMGVALLAATPYSPYYPGEFRVTINSLNQVPYEGDSGGPCWFDVNNGKQMVGIDAFGDNYSYSVYTGVERLRDWALKVVGASYADGLFALGAAASTAGRQPAAGVTSSYSFTPCPGGLYRWTATFDATDAVTIGGVSSTVSWSTGTTQLQGSSSGTVPVSFRRSGQSSTPLAITAICPPPPPPPTTPTTPTCKTGFRYCTALSSCVLSDDYSCLCNDLCE